MNNSLSDGYQNLNSCRVLALYVKRDLIKLQQILDNHCDKEAKLEKKEARLKLSADRGVLTDNLRTLAARNAQ